VVSAIPPDMALVLPFSHCGFSFLWPWRVHNGRNHIPLHESTPERQSLFESHRQRRWLTHWSYLVYAEFGGEVFHILFAVDVPAEHVRVVTAYRPDPEAWEVDQKTRRRS